MKIPAESAANVENVIGVTPPASGALQPEVELAFQMFKVAIREYCFIKETSFSELEDLHELEKSSSQHQSVNLVLTDPGSSTCSARGHASSAHNVSWEEDINDAVWLTSFVMAAGAHDKFFCSSLMFLH